MQARTLTRTLLVSAALAVASSAMAQSTDKERSTTTTSKQSTTKSSAAKPAAATKRLDFSPSSNIKETTTRPAAPGATTQSPGNDGWHCDHSGASDA